MYSREDYTQEVRKVVERLQKLDYVISAQAIWDDDECLWDVETLHASHADVKFSQEMWHEMHKPFTWVICDECEKGIILNEYSETGNIRVIQFRGNEIIDTIFESGELREACDDMGIAYLGGEIPFYKFK